MSSGSGSGSGRRVGDGAANGRGDRGERGEGDEICTGASTQFDLEMHLLSLSGGVSLVAVVGR